MKAGPGHQEDCLGGYGPLLLRPIVKIKVVNKNRQKYISGVEIRRQGTQNNYDKYFKVFARKDGQDFSGKMWGNSQ